MKHDENDKMRVSGAVSHDAVGEEIRELSKHCNGDSYRDQCPNSSFAFCCRGNMIKVFHAKAGHVLTLCPEWQL